MRIGVVLNPWAGRADEAAGIESALAVVGTTTVYEATEFEGTVAAARQAIGDGCELVVAAGGDGTVNAVVNALADAQAQVRLGVLPLGTGNDFARSIEMPLELEDALATLRAGRFAKLDIIRVAGATAVHGINVATAGFTGEVNEELTDEMKRRWGPLAYIRAALEALVDLEAYRVELVLDGDERIDDRCVSVVIANGRYVAGGLPIAPQAELTDGRLDVIVVRAVPATALAALAPRILTGRHLESPHVLFRRARRVRVDSDPPLPFNLDGEPIGEGGVELEIEPARLEVIVGIASSPE